MFTASFIYQPGEYDTDFHALNAEIDRIALATEGYLGQESWVSRDGAKANATYYWDNLECLREFSRHTTHLQAKRQYRRWYNGFHIVIAEVIRSYGDGQLEHITPNQRQRSPGEQP